MQNLLQELPSYETARNVNKTLVHRANSCVMHTLTSAHVPVMLQALTLWLQYISLLGQVNIPAPETLHWLFSAASFAFSSLTSGSLSTDCLLSPGPVNLAFKRLLLRLAVPPISLCLLAVPQTLLHDFKTCLL